MIEEHESYEERGMRDSTILTEALGYIFQLLFQRQLIELLAERELAVNALLRDIEILHVEEAILAHSPNELCR